MNVLLVQPPIRDFYRTSIRSEPIGLAYLAASLREDGHEVQILDCQTEQKRAVPVPSELSYLKDLYPFYDKSPFKLYTGFYHFGMWWEDIRKRIEDSKADVFGISSSFTPYHGEALGIARIVKEWDQRKIVVMGGAHVSCDPEGVLKSPDVDYVVLGEGEVRFSSLLDLIERKKSEDLEEIDGIGFHRDGALRIHPPREFIHDLDSLPHPARDLYDPGRYRIGKRYSTTIITSRGCPHHCAYCSAHLIMGRAFRARSPEAVIREMLECRTRLGTRLFDIEDDNFTFDRDRAKRLMRGIIEGFGEEKPELRAMNGISFASLDGELLQLMKQAGFRTVNLSFVSTFPSTIAGTLRPEGGIGFERILEETERSGLEAVVYAILGMPDQSIEEMVDTLIYLMGKRVLIGPSVYYPSPGTPLFQRCQERGILPPHSCQWRSAALPIQTEAFDRLDLSTLLRLARTINFLKGKMDETELEEGLTWKGLFQVLKNQRGKAKAEVKGGEEAKTKVEVGERNGRHWMELLRRMIEERSFFSLKREPNGECLILRERSSKRVLDCFLEKARQRPVLKSRTGLWALDK